MKNLVVSSLLHLLLLVAVAQCAGNAKKSDEKLGDAEIPARSMREAEDGRSLELLDSLFHPKPEPPKPTPPSGGAPGGWYPPWQGGGQPGGWYPPSPPWNGGGQPGGWYPPSPPWNGGGQPGGWYPPSPPSNGGGQPGGWYPQSPPWNGGGWWWWCNPPDPTCPRCKDLQPNSPKHCRDFCLYNKHCFCWPF